MTAEFFNESVCNFIKIPTIKCRIQIAADFLKNSTPNLKSRCFDLITKFNFPIRILSNISDRHYTWLHLKTHYFWCLLPPLQHHIFASKSSDDWLITFSAKHQLFRPDWKYRKIFDFMSFSSHFLFIVLVDEVTKNRNRLHDFLYNVFICKARLARRKWKMIKTNKQTIT